MKRFLSLLMFIIIIGTAQANVIYNNINFDLGNGVNVTVNANQTFDNISVYNSLASPSNTFEISVNNVTQRFTPTNSISLCSDNCTGMAAPTTILSTSPRISFAWNETNLNPPYNYQLARDIAFISSFFSGSLGGAPFYTTAQTGLEYNRTYFWHIHNSTSTYATSRIWEFRTPLAPAVIPGYLNVSVLDELTYEPISNFTASVYADGFFISKNTTTGIVNFTGSEIVSGEFTLVITPNSSYAERAIIVQSPGGYIVYLPPTTRTIDFVSFYLLDYTGRFPYLDSFLTVTKGVNITHSQYFDSDAKVAVNLIRGEQYTITVTDPLTNSIQQWGNYFSVGTGSVQVVIMNIGVNGSILQPYVQQINASSSSIDVSWSDRGNVLNWVNVSVYKDNTSAMVYSLNTTIGTGTASYMITDLNATYFTVVNASTTIGYKTDFNIFDLRKAVGLITNWAFGNFVMPDWVKNAFAIIIMFMLAGSFGAMHRGEGAVVTGIMGMFMWWYNILNLNGAILALFGALVFYAVLYHLETKRRQGGYF